MPISLTYLQVCIRTFMQNVIIDGKTNINQFTDRLSYCHQIMIGRKFNSRFSFQLTGQWFTTNLMDKISDKK